MIHSLCRSTLHHRAAWAKTTKQKGPVRLFRDRGSESGLRWNHMR